MILEGAASIHSNGNTWSSGNILAEYLRNNKMKQLIF